MPECETRSERSYCRICTSMCGIVVETQGDQVLRVRGDRDHPVTHGYLCPKGRALPKMHHHPQRLERPLLRVGESFQPTSWEVCLDDLTARLRKVIDQHGPASVGIFFGSGLVIYVGINPMVSHGHTIAMPNPAVTIRTAAKRGEVWVIDPLETETVGFASHHVAPRPGTDYAILAYLVRELLREGADEGVLARSTLMVMCCVRLLNHLTVNELRQLRAWMPMSSLRCWLQCAEPDEWLSRQAPG